MKKYARWFLFLIVLYSLQTSLLPIISYRGISPDLLLLLITSFALLEGAKYGTLMALGAGLLKGLGSGTFFGIDTFSFMIIAFFVGRSYNQVYREAKFLPLAASVGVTTLHYLIFASFMFMLGFRFSPLEHMQSVLLPMLLYQLVFSYPVHRLTVKMDAWTRREWSQNGS
ncbi:MAG: rod shape-determining protein MreD [Selenomonadaceae bacterium]|nr:rod shape-determining protein MreD [Selenomonadaceae bacterium]